MPRFSHSRSNVGRRRRGLRLTQIGLEVLFATLFAGTFVLAPWNRWPSAQSSYEHILELKWFA